MPTTIDLFNLGSAGFIIQGDAIGDHAGWSVSSAGDINGDGFEDFIFGAPTGDDGGNRAGEAYVIFGHAGSFANIDLTTMTPSQGFTIQGDDVDNYAGRSVSSAGDVNGDGFDDLIVGAPFGDNGGSSAGEAYVIFGRATGFGAVLDLSNLTVNDGFIIQGDIDGDQAGFSVSSAGDINGDGYDDILVGAPRGDDGGSEAGEAYVIFGRSGGFGPIDLTTLTPAEGFVIQGDTSGTQAGFAVSSAGDINGDGFGDIVVGAPYASTGRAYVIFGDSGGFGSVSGGRSILDLTGLGPSDGFIIQRTPGASNGRAVSSAGDVNGDGFEDVLVTARFAGVNVPPESGFGNGQIGESYIVFGKAGGFGTIDVATLAPADGFVVIGDQEYDRIGWSAASAGDVNGDGFDDIVLGGPDRSKTYVVFGKAGGFGTLDANGRAVIDLTNLGASEGFLVKGHASAENAGFSVSSADINGDGFSEIIIGAPYGSLGGNVSGQVYVIYGVAPTGPVNRTGTDASQTLAGGSGDDVLDGRGGNDTIYGNGGSDSIYGGVGADVMRGGTGNDYYVLDSASDQVIEAVGEGNDTAFVLATSFALAAGSEVENLGAYNEAATDAINLAGNEFANRIVGNNGDNILDGKGGNDTIYGGGGSDSIYGGGGVDTLIGNAGNDYYVVDNAGDRVIEAVGEGNDYVYATVSYALLAGSEVEVLAAYNPAGTSALDLTGNEFANLIDGNAGSNSLDGGAGADDLYGEGGNDYYVVDNAGDRTFEAAGGGYDIVFARTSYTLLAGQEVESLGTLNQAGTEAINLTGNAFANRIVGNEGANVINGGAGADELYGQGGADTFAFTTAPGGTNVDILADFNPTDDTIALDDAVFTGLGLGALNPNAFVVGTAAQDADDRIIYDSATGRLFFDADGNGAGAAVQFATLSTHPVLTASDFTVI